MKKALRILALLAFVLLVNKQSWAQMTFTSGALTQTQNFDGLPTNITGNNITTAVIGHNWFRHDGTNQTQALTSNVVLNSNTNGLAHGVYNCATSASGAGSSDRAIGAVASGSGVHRIGVELKNTTGSTVSKFDISGNVEKYRNGNSTAVTERVAFEYSTNATSLNGGTWTAITALDLVEPSNTNVAVTLGIDGNDAANKAAFSGSITGLSLANNASVWIRWVDADVTGTDALLALDDVSVTATIASSTPTVQLSSNVTTGTEAGTTSITLTATASAAVSGAQTVDLALTGTGVTAGDFSTTFTTIAIASGATTGTRTFTIANDATYECSESATFTISNPTSGITLGATVAQTIAITDDDFPTVNLSANTNVGAEATATSVTLTATASAAVIGAQTVTVGLSGTVLTNSDFSGGTFPATITIANGATTGTLTFTVANDAIYEGLETATFTISAPSSCVALGATTTQTLAIADNDLPSVGLNINTSTGSEAAATSVTLTANSAAAVLVGESVTVSLTGTGLSNADFTGVTFPVTINISAGNTTGSVTFTVNNDATYECSETATFTMSSPTSGLSLGSPTSQTLAITDNDQPAVDLSINTNTASEASATSITLTATAAQAVIGAQTVSVALTGTGLANSDFSGANFPATITIANGATTGTATFTINNDVAVEGTETATFTISSPSACVALGSTLSQTLTITDNDFPSVNLSISPSSGTEAGATAVTLTATAGSAVIGAQTVTVSLTGTGLTNSDFTGVTFPATITIANGATTGTLSFNIADDNTAESAETATFTISSPTSGIVLGATTTRTLAITDNPFSYIVLNAVNTPATENFAGMGTSATASTQTGFAIQDGNTTTVSAVVTQESSTGSPTAGGVYNWGQNGTADRALGFMFSGGVSGKSIVAAVKNNTGTAGTVFEIQFNYEQYRRNTAAQTFKLQYSTALTGTWSDVPGGAFSNILTGTPTGYNFTTLIASQSINIQYSPTLSVANGAVVYFRWILDGSSSSNGVGIDDVSIALVTNTCAAPTTQSQGITFSNVTQNGMDVAWTSGNGDNRVVYMNSSNSFTAPTDGATLPATNTTWANAGQQLIYNGNGSGVTGISNLTANTTYWFRVYDFNCTSLNTKFNTSTATSNPNSRTTNVPASTASVIQAVSSSEATTISSLTNGTITTSSQGTQVWQFKLFDGDGTNSDADGLPTSYTQFTIRQGTGNTVTDWATVIDNVKFFKGASTTPISGSFLVSPSTISFFPTTGISVAQGAGSFELITMRITLDNPLAAGSDGKYLVFKLDNADVTVGASNVSSQLATFSPSSASLKNQIDVAATLQFINAPGAVVLANNFSVTVSAIDANGNIDQNQTTAITLSQTSGSGALSGLSTQNLVNGTYTFTGLSYNQVGTFEVTAAGGSFSPISATIVCTNDPFQSFDDFNRTASSTVGVPSSGGATPWSETSTLGDDGSRVRVENGQLVLANCNSSQSGQSTNGIQQLLYNVENKYETVYDNANGPLTWEFNMRANRTLSLSGFDANNYAVGMILGCDKPDVTDATASGYAVTLGAPGTTDYVRLVRFTSGLRLNSNVTQIAASTFSAEQDYYSVKVSYNPCNDTWSLSVRSDGSSAFAAPNTGTYSAAVTATDATHSALDLKYFGSVWKHGNSCTEDAQFDNFFIPNAATAIAGTKTWNGSVAPGDWNEPNNWSPCPGVPVATENVVIPVTANNPVITTVSGVCKDITINSGVIVTVNSGRTLTFSGNFIGGTSTASTVTGTGSIVLTGGSAQTLSGRTSFTTLNLNKNTGTTATMQAGSAFDINTAVELESGTLATGSGTLTFKSTSTTQIAVLDNFTFGYRGTITGNVTAERYYNATGTTNQHYMGSPVSTTLAQFGATATSSAFVTPKPTCDETALANTTAYGSVFSYDQSNGASCSLAGWKVEASSVAATAAKGFAVTKTGAGTLSISGAPNLATSYSQSGTNSGWSNSSLQGRPMTAGWVLVSNPYLAYLDFTTQGAPTNFTSEVKVWRTTGAFAGSYQDLQPGEMIAPFQGFFVHSTATGSYPINGNKRTRSTAGTFQAQANDQQLSILATNNSTTLADITMVAFNSDATTGFDNDYDAQKIAGTLGRHTLYTVGANNLWMSKNIHKSIAETSTITMGFEPEVAGTYTFSFEGLNSFDPTSYIMLEDRKLGTMYNVRNGDYQFTSDTADQWERFVLHFTPAAEVTATDESCNSLGNINVSQPGTANWNYTIADANNAIVATGTLNETTPISTAVATGTYTLTLTDNNNYTVAKTVTVNGAGAVAAVFTPSVTATQTNLPVNFTSSSVATSYYWDFGDGTTESGQNVIHSYADTGTYTVTLIVISEGGCSTSSSQTVTVSQTATGIGTITNGGPISIWSNGGRVYVDFSKQSKVDADIQIYNIIGQELVNEKFGRSTIYSKPVTNLEAGYVIVKVKNAGGFTTKKVLITNN